MNLGVASLVVILFGASLVACGDLDGAGGTKKHDGSADAVTVDAQPPSPDRVGTGGAGGLGGRDAAGGATSSGGNGGTGGYGGIGGSAGSGGGVGGGGTTSCGGTTAAGGSVADGGVDAPVFDAGPDGADCGGSNPAAVTCITTKDQCVPSTCGCGVDGLWVCTADCRGGLPMCGVDGGVDAGGESDGGTIREAGGLDGPVACSVTSATLSVVPGSVLDSYCFTGCGLPLRLLKDGVDVDLYDFAHPACGTCVQPPSPACKPDGNPVTAQGYSYALAERYDIAGKCGDKDCSAATCLAPGRYQVIYMIYTKQPDGTCGGTAIELAAEFDYPQAREVKVQFSTLPSCGKNSDCSTGQACFRGTTSSTCVPRTQLCTSRDPNFGRCICPGCTCSGTDDPGSFWMCVT
jgi:hypothetical protein